ncbi:forkhead box protein P3a isoform X3 [Puntigrus tetrazona]|uniref:forkhead box protein P3a isoform X3 n=1 Tax=Puntigrus tetrazona TaxID=1606681 RepID=UPI001C88E945|nr:forkhead box protein P3a isoform X3 [Puntigrus tetrazona]
MLKNQENRKSLQWGLVLLQLSTPLSGMLQNAAGTHKGGDNWKSHQNQYQEEEPSTFSSLQIKARGSCSSLLSGKPMATKVALGSDFRGSRSSHNQNSTLQQQTASENASKDFRQHRPSVLRKGNQPFPQACGVHDWVVDAVCKTEPDSDLSDPVPLYTNQSESPQPGSTGHTGKHLATEHAPGDRSIAQLRMQKDKVQYMENQLTAERQKLQAMQLHLFDIKSTSEDGNSAEKSGHMSELLQPAACQNANAVYDSDRAAAEALTQGYWQISTSHVIPGIIPSFEYYKFTNMRPPFTYASMIRWAILESPEKQLTLNEIYHWFTRMFFYFRHNTATWKNAVRHNLSLHKCFVRVEGRKGSVWTVDEEEFMRRKGQKFHRDQDMGWMAPFHVFPVTPQGETYPMRGPNGLS